MRQNGRFAQCKNGVLRISRSFDRARLPVGFAFLGAALVGLFFWNIAAGSVSLSFAEVADSLFHADSPFRTIVVDARLVRILSAILLGGALALSGFLLQTFFANPIAGPFVLGIASGAKLVMTLTLIGFLSFGLNRNSNVLILASFLGAMLSMGFVLAISHKVRRMSMLVICGVMIGYICSAITELVVQFAEESNIIKLHDWAMGSFANVQWHNVIVIAIVVLTAFVLTFLMSKPIGAYQLGEVYAKNMGVNIPLFRAALILLSGVLSACVTAFAGPVSFVGVAVPHLMRRLFKTAKPIVMIPACFLGGAVFCLFCDLIARTLVSEQLSISSVTAVLGAPIVILVMLRRQKEGER